MDFSDRLLLSYGQFIHHHTYTGGGDVGFKVMGERFGDLETIQMGNRYVAEAHDMQMLANGNIILFGYYMSEVDMSQLVDGGYPGALVSGGVVQELDASRNVVFQWRTWDHFSFEDNTWSGRSRTSKVISQFHLNTINQDIDGQLIVGSPRRVMKLNRQNGEIMWVLGGWDNQFTLIGDEADVSHFGGHATYRIPNGNFLMYDNGSRRQPGSTSKVHEYKLDEVALTATHVWSYEPPEPIPAWHRGNAQRLPNGNTFIGWGGRQRSAYPRLHGNHPGW